MSRSRSAAAARRVVLLGPQKDRPTVASVLAELGVDGPIATVTAGWQAREAEGNGLDARLGSRSVPLRLYMRAQRVWEADPELRDAHRVMQEDLRAIQGLYRRSLAHAADAWMELLASDAPERLVGPERDAALETIKGLDARLLARVAEARAAFDSALQPLGRPAVATERAALERELSSAAAIVIEGGHVAVLHNRLALFGVPELWGDKTVIGCAGGAMLLGSRVLLFDDSPAIGRGHAEVGLPGLGLVPGVVALPSAAERLRLDDLPRMRRLALRLAPDHCAALGAGDRLDWDGRSLTGVGSCRLDQDGTLAPWGRAA